MTQCLGWEIENGKSVFIFKVKLKNKSHVNLTTVQIVLTSVPSCLTADEELRKIPVLTINETNSPTFKLYPQDSCVGATIEAQVNFRDPSNQKHSIDVKPFPIEYICNLLVPKEISAVEFTEKTENMQGQQKFGDIFNLPAEQLEAIIRKVLPESNFYLLPPKDTQAKQSRKIEAFAKGKKDGKEVALSISIQKLPEDSGGGSKYTAQALSEKESKLPGLSEELGSKIMVEFEKLHQKIDSHHKIELEKINGLHALVANFGKLYERLADRVDKIKETTDDDAERDERVDSYLASITKQLAAFGDAFEGQSQLWEKLFAALERISDNSTSDWEKLKGEWNKSDWKGKIKAVLKFAGKKALPVVSDILKSYVTGG